MTLGEVEARIGKAEAKAIEAKIEVTKVEKVLGGIEARVAKAESKVAGAKVKATNAKAKAQVAKEVLGKAKVKSRL